VSRPPANSAAARRRRANLLLAALFASACRIGDLDVPIGKDVPLHYYVAPDGDDANPGTREHPWQTLSHATGRLRPGQTLLLASGEYRLQTTGLLDIDCSGAARQGRADAPITVKADSERGATLRGDGATPPLRLTSCAHWVVEGLVLQSARDTDVPQGVDVGTVAVIQGGNELTLRRSILMSPNPERHSHLLRVLEASRVLVEECEAYDFFHNAFEAVRSEAVVFRRNYLNSRHATSSGSVVGTDDPTRGEVAIQVEESSRSLFENNVAEVVGTGFSVVGRPGGSPYTEPTPYPVSGTRLFGNLVRDALGSAFKIESRCDAATPCDRPERIVSDTLVVHGVAFEAATGIWVDAGPGTRVDNFTAVDVVNGLHVLRSAPNSGLSFAASASRSLVRGYSGVAFWMEAADDWSLDHCAAQQATAEAVAFSPADGNVLSPLTLPASDNCVAYLPAGSALQAAAGADGDVGANVVYRYQDGVLTSEPLWDRETGAFPCGAVVPGINDDPSQSCRGVHERLRVGSQGCPLPTLP
jgi:hypothetical protein